MSDKANLNFVKDGPIKLTGEIDIAAADGKVLKVQDSTSFCRCGASGNKPFCDGSHERIGFKAAADLDAAAK